MTLRDQVRHASNAVGPRARSLSSGVRDADRSLAERLASFDELTRLEVGDTGLLRARGLERATGIGRLYLKYEGDNPTGTQKDRIAFAQVRAALAAGRDTIALATCGNYGVAVSLAAQLAGLCCRVYIPEGYHTERSGEMEALGARVERLPGSYEEVVAQSSALAAGNAWADANPGGPNTALQLAAYAPIAAEISAGVEGTLDLCAVPVSNGTLLAGIYRGFADAFARGHSAGLPRLLAGSSTRKNPIIQSFLGGLAECLDLDPKLIRETTVNEPLINWHAFDGDEALAGLYATRGLAVNVSDKDLRTTASLVGRAEGYRVLPASTAGLYGILREHRLRPLPEGNYVAVLTARS